MRILSILKKRTLIRIILIFFFILTLTTSKELKHNEWITGKDSSNDNECSPILPIQVIFLVDITNHNITCFEQQKEKLLQTLDTIKSAAGIRNLSLGLVAFHRRPVLIIDIDSAKARRHNDVRIQIEKLKPRKRSIDPYPAGAIEFTRDIFIKSYVENAKRLIILAHNGNNSDLMTDTITAKNNVNKLKVDIFAVTGNNSVNVNVENLIYFVENERRIYTNSIETYAAEIENSLDYCETDFGLQALLIENQKKYRVIRRKMLASKNQNIERMNLDDEKMKCNAENVDLIILLDTTGISKKHFENEKAMVFDLINQLDEDLFDSEVLQVAIISFCDVATIHLPFNLGKNKKKDVLKVVENIDYTGNMTLISKGIEVALEELNKSFRKKTKQFLVLVSDGHGKEYWHKVKSTSKKLTDYGCEVFAVSSSNNYNAVELKMYTGGNKDRVFVGRTLKNFKDQLLNDMEKCFKNSPNIKLQAELNRGLTSTKLSITTTTTTTSTTTTTTTTTSTTTTITASTTELSLAVILERGVGKFIGNADCKKDPVDIMIILDVSTSITDVFDRQKQVALDLIQIPSEDDFKHRIRVGLVTFNQEAKLIFDLEKFKSKEDILSSIVKLKHTGGQTSLLSGVNRAIEELTLSQRHNKAKLITLIISDGNSRDNWNNVARGAKKLRDLECVVYSVTASDYYHYNELKEYAGANERVFTNGHTPKFVSMASEFLFGCKIDESDFVKEERSQIVDLVDTNRNTVNMLSKDSDSKFKGNAKKLNIFEKNQSTKSNSGNNFDENDKNKVKTITNQIGLTSLSSTEKFVDESSGEEIVHKIDGHLIESSGEEPENFSNHNEAKSIELEAEQVDLKTHLEVQTTQNPRDKNSNSKELESSKNNLDSRPETFNKLSRKFNLPESESFDDEGGKVNLRGQAIVGQVKNFSKEQLNKFASDRSNEHDRDDNVEELPKDEKNDSLSGRANDKEDFEEINNKNNENSSLNESMDIIKNIKSKGTLKKGTFAKSNFNNSKTNESNSGETNEFLTVESSAIEITENNNDNEKDEMIIDINNNISLSRPKIFPNRCKIDLLFVIDSSQSVDNSFEKQILLAIDLIKQIPSSDFNDRIKVGALAFTRVCSTKFEIGQYKKKEDIVDELMKIKHLGGGTSVVSGLKRAIKTFKRDGRKDAMQMIVLLSDGNSFDHWRDVIKTARNLRKIESTLFAISLSQNYYLSELELYAGNKWYVYVDGRTRQFLRDAEIIIQRCTGPLVPKENQKNNEKSIKNEKENINFNKNTTELSNNSDKKSKIIGDFDLTNAPVIKTMKTEFDIKDKKTVNLNYNNSEDILNNEINLRHLDQCQNDLVDLTILFDVSASIIKEFYEEKSFVTDLIKILPNKNFNYRFRISVITFNKAAKKVVSLADSKSRNDILYEIERIMQASGATSLTAAAEAALQDIKLYKRPNSRIVTVIVSDGNSQDEWDSVLQVSKKFKNTIGKDIYAVTLSPKYYFDELKEYTGKDDHIFVDEKINNFMKYVGEIILACKENPKPSITMAPEESVQPTLPSTINIIRKNNFFTTNKPISLTTINNRNEEDEDNEKSKEVVDEEFSSNTEEKTKNEEIQSNENNSNKNETVKNLHHRNKKIFSAEVIERSSGRVSKIIDEVPDFKAKDMLIDHDNKNTVLFGSSSHEIKEATKLKCRYYKMDIVVILDASTSRKEVFDAQRELTLSLIEKLPISKDNDNVALCIISFTSQAFLREPLGIGKNKDELRRVVENIEYKGGSTATSEGILMAINEIQLKRRKNAFQLIVLMNDGMSQDDWSVVTNTSKLLHSTGTHVIGVAMGNDVDFRELNLYVSLKKRLFRDNQTEAFLNSIINLLNDGVEEECHQYEYMTKTDSPIILSNNDDKSTPNTENVYMNSNKKEKHQKSVNNFLNFKNSEEKKYRENDNNDNNKIIDLNNLQEIHEENTESCILPDIDLVVIFDTAATQNSKESDIVQQNRYLLTDLIGSLPVNDRLKMSIITFENSPTIIHEFSNEQDKKHLYMASERIIPKEGDPSYSKAVDAAYEYYISNKRNTSRGIFLIMGDGKSSDIIEDRSFSANKIRRDKSLNCYALHSGIDMDNNALKSYTGSEDKIYNFERNSEFMNLLIRKIKAGDSENCRRAKAVLNNNDTTANEETYLTIKEKYKMTLISKNDQPNIDIKDMTVTMNKKIPLRNQTIDDETCLIDLLLLIDSSNSVKNIFKKVLEIASNIIEQLKIGENNAHVSIIQMSSEADTKVIWKFNSPQSKGLILRSIHNTKYRGGPSSINKGLQVATNEYNVTNGARINRAYPIVIIFSDGFDHNNMTESANILRKIIPNIYAISVTDEFPYNLRELEKITDNPNRVFTSENLSDFFNVFKQYTVNC
uniref:COL6A n=1 Tax=Strongyloides venezuelensis TaxID=75913 RepID=A0A0K0F9M5_STRVS